MCSTWNSCLKDPVERIISSSPGTFCKGFSELRCLSGAELTVQQKLGLQPPPLNPECDPEDENPESTEQELLKVEFFFLISLEPHLGHTVSPSVVPTR